MELIAQGKIHNREDIIKALQNMGYTFSRIGKDYLTIVDSEGNKNRLKGTLYNEDFNEKAWLEQYMQKEVIVDEPNLAQAAKADEALQKTIIKTAEYNKKCYSIAKENIYEDLSVQRITKGTILKRRRIKRPTKFRRAKYYNHSHEFGYAEKSQGRLSTDVCVYAGGINHVGRPAQDGVGKGVQDNYETQGRITSTSGIDASTQLNEGGNEYGDGKLQPTPIPKTGRSVSTIRWRNRRKRGTHSRYEGYYSLSNRSTFKRNPEPTPRNTSIKQAEAIKEHAYDKNISNPRITNGSKFSRWRWETAPRNRGQKYNYPKNRGVCGRYTQGRLSSKIYAHVTRVKPLGGAIPRQETNRTHNVVSNKGANHKIHFVSKTIRRYPRRTKIDNGRFLHPAREAIRRSDTTFAGYDRWQNPTQGSGTQCRSSDRARANPRTQGIAAGIAEYSYPTREELIAKNKVIMQKIYHQLEKLLGIQSVEHLALQVFENYPLVQIPKFTADGNLFADTLRGKLETLVDHNAIHMFVTDTLSMNEALKLPLFDRQTIDEVRGKIEQLNDLNIIQSTIYYFAYLLPTSMHIEPNSHYNVKDKLVRLVELEGMENVVSNVLHDIVLSPLYTPKINDFTQNINEKVAFLNEFNVMEQAANSILQHGLPYYAKEILLNGAQEDIGHRLQQICTFTVMENIAQTVSQMTKKAKQQKSDASKQRADAYFDKLLRAYDAKRISLAEMEEYCQQAPRLRAKFKWFKADLKIKAQNQITKHSLEALSGEMPKSPSPQDASNENIENKQEKYLEQSYTPPMHL